MAFYLKTNLDPAGKFLRIEKGFRAADGSHYLVLYRLPPHYSKPPLFVVRLSGDAIEVRKAGGVDDHFLKAYANPEFTQKELGYLVGLKPGGTHAPFFNFSYPNVLKRMGKTLYCMTDAEVQSIACKRVWKLTPGQ